MGMPYPTWNPSIPGLHFLRKLHFRLLDDFGRDGTTALYGTAVLCVALVKVVCLGRHHPLAPPLLRRQALGGIFELPLARVPGLCATLPLPST